LSIPKLAPFSPACWLLAPVIDPPAQQAHLLRRQVAAGPFLSLSALSFPFAALSLSFGSPVVGLSVPLPDFSPARGLLVLFARGHFVPLILHGRAGRAGLVYLRFGGRTICPTTRLLTGAWVSVQASSAHFDNLIPASLSV
jgi:hypothetical protein